MSFPFGRRGLVGHWAPAAQAGRSLFYGRMDSRDMGLEKRKEDAENARALFSWVVAFVMSTPMLEGGGDSAGSRTVLFGRAHSCERNAKK